MPRAVFRAVGAGAAIKHACRALSSTQPFLSPEVCKRVLGCGSNVVDHIYNVKVVPNAGQKGFFLSPFRALEKKLIGGVTLNHLAWAALGGVPSGLLALQGKDDLGYFIRSNLKKLGVTTEFIKTDDKFTTAQCHVFIQEDGERSIVMAPAATSLINTQSIMEHFDAAIKNHASMVTTEISQVPLTGVMAILNSARKANVLSILDLDVPPSVAMNEARLGSIEEVIECAKSADILKPAKAAAEELLQIMMGSKTLRLSHHEMAVELVRLCGSKLVAITNGEQPCILANKDMVVEVAPPTVPKVTDTTGAGDAFLGGLIVAVSNSGMPCTEDDMKKIGRIANAYGATCVQSVGGVPVNSSSDILQQYLPERVSSSSELSSGSSQGRLHSFNASLQRDVQGTKDITEKINYSELAMFLDTMEDCQGQILVSGVGKSGHVAHRFASSLSSVGISSHFVHASEWIHGDLGKAQPGKDIVLFISHSGNIEECVAAATHLIGRGVTTLTLTSGQESKLSKLSMASLCYSAEDLQETFGCLPSTSLVLQEMLLNAIVNELISRRGITREDFKLNHPGGTIGTIW